MKYLLTGGGTGGHVYPALAMADEIRRTDPEARFLYVGLRNKLESRVAPGRGYLFKSVRSTAFPRSSGPLAYLKFGLVVGLGVLKAMWILLRFRPRVIIGTGGYVSAPVMFAYAILSRMAMTGAVVFAYEPNVHPGLLNQVVGGLAHRIGVAFEPAARWFDMKKVAVVGYPVRRELERLDREGARRQLGIPQDAVVVMVFGGSGGARAINDGIVDALPYLAERRDVRVLHITGRYVDKEYNAVVDTESRLNRIECDTGSYHAVDYMDNIQEGYAAADLVVCRAGAGTVTEICACGLPAIIVPLPISAEDHQAFNARQLESLGASCVHYEEAAWEEGVIRSTINGERLAQQILALVDDPDRRRAMAQAAAKVPLKDSLAVIVEQIEALVEGVRPKSLNLEFPQQPQGMPANPNALLRQVIERVAEVGGAERLDECERSYLQYQADRLLTSEAWYEIPLGRRNVGLKLVGHLKYEARLPLLLSMVQERRKVGLHKRLFGGDFVHGGILRRNAIELGIGLLGVANDEVKTTLLEVLERDPYFEVRAASARVLGQLFGPDDAVEAALVNALDDSACRVVIQAIRALGDVARNPDVLERMEAFYLHSNWQYRQEVVVALRRLLDRGVLCRERVAADVDQILATSPYFEPEFPLKENLLRLAEAAAASPSIPAREAVSAGEGS